MPTLENLKVRKAQSNMYSVKSMRKWQDIDCVSSTRNGDVWISEAKIDEKLKHFSGLSVCWQAVLS